MNKNRRKRYLILEIDKIIDKEKFQSILVENIIFLVGIMGLSLVIPTIVYTKDKFIVLRTSIDGLTIMRSLILLKGNLNGINVKIIKVTGSFKKAKSICDSYLSK